MAVNRMFSALAISLFWGSAPPGTTELRGRPDADALHPVVMQVKGILPVRERVRICTYNLEHFSDGVGEPNGPTPEMALAHAKAAARLVEEIEPDVLVVQEVEGREAVRLLNSQLAYPFPLAYVTDFESERRQESKLNVAVFSRHELVGVRELDFDPLRGNGAPPRGAISFGLDLERGSRLLVYGVHLKSNFGDGPRNIVRRRNALQLIAADAEREGAWREGGGIEALVIGDMNVDPARPEFAQDATLAPLAQWIDLWKDQPAVARVTVPTRLGDPALEFPPAAFDRFYASGALAVPPWTAGVARALQKGVDTNDVTTPPGAGGHVSDHYPVWIDVDR